MNQDTHEGCLKAVTEAEIRTSQKSNFKNRRSHVKNKKWSVIVITLILAVLFVIGGSAILVNYVVMPNPIVSLGKTLANKYIPETKFDFSALSKEGKIAADINFEKNNAMDMPQGTMNAALSYNNKKNSIAANAKIYDEPFALYASPEAMAVQAENFNDGTWYGVTLENFRDQLDDSIFSPKSKSDYALDEDVYEIICESIELLEEDTSKQTKDDVMTLLSFVYAVFEDSKLSDTETDYGTKTILGESRWGRSEIYTVNERNLEEFLVNLSEAMDDADGDVRDAADRVLESINGISQTLTGEKIRWKDLIELIELTADEVDLGGGEITIEICYSATYVSAILIQGRVYDEEIEIIVDFGKKPAKSMNTTVYVLVDDTEIYAELIETKKSKSTIYELTIDCEEAYYSYINNSRKLQTYNWTLEAELELDRGNQEAYLVVLEHEDGDRYELLNVECGYEDTKKTWSLSLDELVVGEESVYSSRKDGIYLSLSLFLDADMRSKPKFENLLEYRERDIDRIIDDFEEYQENFEKKFATKEEDTGNEMSVVNVTSSMDDIEYRLSMLEEKGWIILLQHNIDVEDWEEEINEALLFLKDAPLRGKILSCYEIYDETYVLEFQDENDAQRALAPLSFWEEEYEYADWDIVRIGKVIAFGESETIDLILNTNVSTLPVSTTFTMGNIEKILSNLTKKVSSDQWDWYEDNLTEQWANAIIDQLAYDINNGKVKLFWADTVAQVYHFELKTNEVDIVEFDSESNASKAFSTLSYYVNKKYEDGSATKKGRVICFGDRYLVNQIMEFNDEVRE